MARRRRRRGRGRAGRRAAPPLAWALLAMLAGLLGVIAFLLRLAGR